MATDLPGAEKESHFIALSYKPPASPTSGCIHLLQPTGTQFYSPVCTKKNDSPTEAFSAVHAVRHYLLGILKWGVGRNESETLTLTDTLFMTPTIASILNLMGPDMMVILLIVLLLVGAKKLPELARGMGRAVKEFSAARDEFERELSQPASQARKSEVLDAKAVLPSAR
jgi:TatA/E family protein of Tat protein translocase